MGTALKLLRLMKERGLEIAAYKPVEGTAKLLTLLNAFHYTIIFASGAEG